MNPCVALHNDRSPTPLFPIPLPSPFRPPTPASPPALPHLLLLARFSGAQGLPLTPPSADATPQPSLSDVESAVSALHTIIEENNWKSAPLEEALLQDPAGLLGAGHCSQAELASLQQEARWAPAALMVQLGLLRFVAACKGIELPAAATVGFRFIHVFSRCGCRVLDT